MKLIRKISIGSDLKSGAMAFSVGQYMNLKGSQYKIHNIKENEKSYDVYIEKEDEVLPWKTFNKNMAIAIEYDLDY